MKLIAKAEGTVMPDDQFLQADIQGEYFPPLPMEREQAERLEREGYLLSFFKPNNLGLPPEKVFRLTSKGKERVPRYQ